MDERDGQVEERSDHGPRGVHGEAVGDDDVRPEMILSMLNNETNTD